MAKLVEVVLEELYAETGGFGSNDYVDVSGGLRGVTYNKVLMTGGAVTAVEMARHDVFTFPEGPLRLFRGEATPVDAGMRIALSIGENLDPSEPKYFGYFLDFGGELFAEDIAPLSLGESFGTISSADVTQPGLARHQDVTFAHEGAGIAVQARFRLAVVHYF
ncbi:hypothetical protein [Kitasatospora sp. NPDC002965]|uniref:hypothetical protein n=1 Tax=Kitasatospora sp. NPDC002965 TaxID=3154775 RepID=UPI00339F2D33